MSSASRGTVLAGRYRLDERLHSNPDGATWRAVDTALDRQVSVYVMRPGHPFAADVADAARRAALVDDPRLVRVLNVETEGDIGFVVSEYVAGDTLGTLVERSPLSPVAARRIVGEVAEGLDVAAKRGLHHLRLTPRSVIVGRDGRVKIFGTAVEAAAAGLEPAHATRAGRIDAAGLVGLLYSGLTGRWPMGDAGFPPAPRAENGGPVPPGSLVRGIPTDLDTLCVVTLGPADDGPRSPAELVRELSPWPSAQEVPLRTVTPARASTARPTAVAPAKPDDALTVRNRPTAQRAPSAPPTSSAPPAVNSGNGRSRSFTPPTAAGPSVEPSESLFRSQPMPPTGPIPKISRPAAGPPAAPSTPAKRPGAPADPALPAPTRPDPTRAGGAVFPEAGGASSGASKFTGAPRKASAPRNSGGRPPGPGTQPAPGRPGSHRSSRNGSRAASRAAGPPPPANRRSGPAPNTQELLLPGWQQRGVANPPSDLGSTGGFPIVIPAESPPQRQSRLVLFAVAAVLILGLAFAGYSLRDIGSPKNLIPSDAVSPLPSLTTAAPSVSPSQAPAATTTAAATPTTTTATAPVEVASVRAIDPQGDGDENSSDAKNVLDSKASTTWNSQTYYSAAFSNLKQGVGLAFKLKEEAAVSQATIKFAGSGGAVELRTADGPDLTGSKVVGKASLDGGSVTVTAKSAGASQYVILWFTKLPSSGGKYRLEISEVRLQ